jgi:hypothetical protein
VFDPDAHMPRINRAMVYLGACLIAGIRLARERQVNVRVVPTGNAIEESVDYIISAKELDIRRIRRKVLVTHASLVRYASGNHYMVKRPNLNRVKRNVRRTALQTA